MGEYQDQLLREELERTESVFTKHGVNVEFDITVTVVEDFTKEGRDLKSLDSTKDLRDQTVIGKETGKEYSASSDVYGPLNIVFTEGLDQDSTVYGQADIPRNTAVVSGYAPRVTAHEVGHLFGLPHWSEPYNLMYPEQPLIGLQLNEEQVRFLNDAIIEEWGNNAKNSNLSTKARNPNQQPQNAIASTNKNL